MLNIPDVVQNKARSLGADAWLARLPDLVTVLASRWSLRLGDSFSDATEAYVCAATDDTGSSCVLKVIIPRDGAARHEATVLRLARGEGCALLLREDLELGALLSERLGPSLNSLGLSLDARLEILCTTVERLWRPAPDTGLPSGLDKANWLQDFISSTWERLNRPCSEEAVAYALACADRRALAHDDERAVLVHGDVHQWNVLVAGDHFKLIDPDGLLAEAEYDLGVIMREDPREMMTGDPFERARRLGARCQLDPVAIWEWGVVERVSTGLLASEVELQPVGWEMLRVAERVAGLKTE